MEAQSRLGPKRAVVKPWPFGFRISPGHLKLDLGIGDPAAVGFVNRTDFAVEFHFGTPFLRDPKGGGPLRVLAVAPGQEETRDLLGDADGWYQYEARVMVNRGGGIEYIEASGGSRPDIDVRR
jgi:hypothetical protein